MYAIDKNKAFLQFDDTSHRHIRPAEVLIALSGTSVIEVDQYEQLTKINSVIYKK
jgi:hypothetical protein